MKKAQAVIIDLMIAFFIFILILGFTSVVWNRYTVQLELELAQNDKWNTLNQMSEVLIRTEGLPHNWHELPEDQIEVIGLLDQEQQISRDKIIALSDLGAEVMKEKFNVQLYSMNMTFLDEDGSTSASYAISEAPEQGIITTITRYVRFDNETKRLQITIN